MTQEKCQRERWFDKPSLFNFDSCEVLLVLRRVCVRVCDRKDQHNRR